MPAKPLPFFWKIVQRATWGAKESRMRHHLFAPGKQTTNSYYALYTHFAVSLKIVLISFRNKKELTREFVNIIWSLAFVDLAQKRKIIMGPWSVWAQFQIRNRQLTDKTITIGFSICIGVRNQEREKTDISFCVFLYFSWNTKKWKKPWKTLLW